MAQAKFDIKTEATRTLFAGVGAADLAVEAVRDFLAEFQAKAADVQKNVAGIDYNPAYLREQALTVVDSLTGDAKATRAAIEARFAELQAEVQDLLNGNVSTANDRYADLAERGEILVGRVRKQESTKATVKSANTTVAKAKTTRTQAAKAAGSTSTVAKTAAKKATKSTGTAARKRGSTAASSAKATVTAARKTAANASDAVADTAEKIGD